MSDRIMDYVMSDRIVGCDMSHWNSNEEFDKALKNPNIKFFILKATEGATYFDPKYWRRAQDVITEGKLLGFYHYARPENNSAEKEAKNFLLRVKEFKGKCIVALDWEGKAVEKNYVKWAREWLDIVEKEMRTAPFIYVSHGFVTEWDLDKIMYNRYPLWDAKWGAEPTKENTGMWNGWSMWQINNKPYDTDVFKGTEEDFKNLYNWYAQEEPDTDKEGCGYCGCCCGCCAKGKQE